MLLGSDVEVLVYRVDDEAFEMIGVLNEYTSMIYPDVFRGYGEFELWAPITTENAELLKEENVIWVRGADEACVIEVIDPSYDENGVGTLDVKGRTLESYLTRRCLMITYKATNKRPSTMMIEMVQQNFTEPTDGKRVMPWLTLADDPLLGDIVPSLQRTGGEVYEKLDDVAEKYGLGFYVVFKPESQELVFEVRGGADKSLDGGGDEVVAMGVDTDDVLSSSYHSNSQDLKTVALVEGEANGNKRKSVMAGDLAGSGLARRELYVDARDLQSEVYDDDGNVTYVTEAEYEQMLVDRGVSKLAECTTVVTFEAVVRALGNMGFIYGVDYNVGDLITFSDERIGVTVNTRVTAGQEEYGNGYNLVLTFGEAAPTVMQKVKRMTS